MLFPVTKSSPNPMLRFLAAKLDKKLSSSVNRLWTSLETSSKRPLRLNLTDSRPIISIIQKEVFKLIDSEKLLEIMLSVLQNVQSLHPDAHILTLSFFKVNVVVDLHVL